MMINRIRRYVTGLGIVCVVAALSLASASAADSAGPLQSLVRLAADRIDAVLTEVAASTRALGDEYRTLAADQSPVNDAYKAVWVGRRSMLDSTAGFRSWPDSVATPAFQAPFPGFYSYRGETVTETTLTHLREFERMVPLMRAAYRSFDFSWVYLTTADDMMLIYPYVPIGEAANNAMPTSQVYYTAADFKRRSVGWTAPYLDLVGAGMMITASYPIYAGDRLLGVASRDITLKQLSRSVLTRLTGSDGATAVIIDQRGLAIDATDAALAAEIEQVNAAMKTAALFYRSSTRRAQQAESAAVVSRFGWINQVTERVLAKAAQSGASELIDIEINGRRALAARIESTGWFVVLVNAKP